MATQPIATRRSLAIPRPELHRAGKVCIGVLGLLGVGAIAGGIALITKPDGSNMGFTVQLLAGSPFTDFTVPGLVLGGLFGVGSFAVVAMGLGHVRLAPFLAFAIGCGQMIWITVELAIIRELSFLHPTFFGAGLLIASTAAVWGWPTFRAWREAR